MTSKISIITATFNSSQFIDELAGCIFNQSYENWEWLIVDDCSTDDTVEHLRQLESKDERIKVFVNKVNSGAAVTRNVALANATGDYLAFVDSDDLWYPEKLQKQLGFMSENNYLFSFTAYSLITEAGEEKSVFIDLNNKKNSFDYDDMLCKKATLGCSTVMIKKNIIDDLRMPLLRTGQDYAFWLKILNENKRAYLLKESLTQYRIVANSISRNKFKKAARQWQIYRKVEGLTLLKSMYCFVNYAYRAVFRG
ncbi:glycosyltransferase family 2 protein [Erwinia rhapontici]|uniref:glycosyltransferase family 2 protein n=1 Tax=Erwinia rhapontici TaxID=55212 RepID=UPI003BA2F94D